MHPNALQLNQTANGLETRLECFLHPLEYYNMQCYTFYTVYVVLAGAWTIDQLD